MDLWQEFHGPNAAYILDLYERFRQDPTSVDPGTQAFFQQWQPNDSRPLRSSETSEVSADKIMAVVNLATAIREYGHLAARIDPLGLSNPPGDPALHTSAHTLTDAGSQSGSDWAGLVHMIKAPLTRPSSIARKNSTA